MGEHDDEWRFRTSGPNCHWCYDNPTAYVWGPYGTNVCDYCQERIEAGQAWQVVESLAAKLTVRDRWSSLDPEGWREREHAQMNRWLEIRTDCQPQRAQ